MSDNTHLKLNQDSLIDDIVFNNSPVTLNIESYFEFIDSPSAGTVIAFDTNIQNGKDVFFVELFDGQGGKTVGGIDAIQTPVTAENFLDYVNAGAYDNSFIHRSVPGFVIQGGGFKASLLPADQLGGDPSPIPSQPSIVNEPGNSNLRGTIAMAKLGGDPNSATNQFFFNLNDANSSNLDYQNGGFTVFGKVLGIGMDVVDVMSEVNTYDASAYYGNGALTDLPLWNVDDDGILKPGDFVSFEDVYVIPEEDLDKRLIEYSVSSSDTTKLDVVLEGGNLIMSPAEDADGTVIVTVTGQSRLGGSPLSNAFSVNLDGDDEATGTLTITGAKGSGPADWQQLGADIDGEAAGDYSGYSVSLSADGSTVAIGATGNDDNGSGAGHVRIYQRNQYGNWQQLGTDIIGETAFDQSGVSVSLSADGSTVAIGAPNNYGNGYWSGHVRIYQRNSIGNWEQVGADIDGEAAGDWSGSSVSLSADGSTIAIGAYKNDGNGDRSGHVRIYQRNSNGNWDQVGADIDGEASGDESGRRVSLSADGSTVAIGALYNDGNGGYYNGHVRIYQYNSATSTWVQVGADIDGEAAGDYSGESVSLSADGSTVAIGAGANDGNGKTSGHVRIYQLNLEGNWEQVGADIDGESAYDQSGHSVSLSADGRTVAIGANSNDGNGFNSGHVRIYQQNFEGNWEQVGADIDGEAAGDQFGISVSLSADGSTVAIGATGNDGNGTDSGHVRIYELNTPPQPQQGDILSANLADVLDADGAIQSTTYQWQSSSDNGLSWTDLSNETNQQLDTSTPSLVGQDVRVTVTTTDASGGTTSFTSAALNITADTDAPIITSRGTAAAIDEHSGADQVIYTAIATDNTSVSYSLKANNNDDVSAFSIDSASGEVSLKADPDYETQSAYSFTVIATDVAGNSSEQSVALPVNDVAELPTLKSFHAIKSKKKVRTFSLNKSLKIEGQELDTAIIGTKKKDSITGTSKNEILAGFKGKDVLKGGGGADGFLFDKPVGFGKKQMDKILDFDSEELDKILVDRKAFGLGRKIKFRAVSRKSQLKKASRTKVDFVYENKTGLLYFNENGKRSGFGDGGLFVRLQGKPELFADDFRIV